MCTKPHPIAKKAYLMFLNSNLGDPGLFPGSLQLEREVINELASLLHGENCVGSLVSGGTEANMLALLAARNMANVKDPEVVLPKSAHFSFTKICGMLKLKPVYVDLDDSFRVDLSKVEACIRGNTVAIVGTAGTSELGVVDPIEGLSDLALKRDVYFHVDAAFGGLVLPFLPNGGKFDFQLPAVKSMTVDPHKMGMAAIPTGGAIFRDTQTIDHLKTETPYLTNRFQYTFVGTRPGASAASAWAVFRLLGVEGFKKIVDKCMKTTRLLTNELKAARCCLVTEPTLNIAAFRSPKGTKHLAQSLWQRGWFVSYVPRYDCIRVVVMPHVQNQHALAFLADLRDIEKI